VTATRRQKLQRAPDPFKGSPDGSMTSLFGRRVSAYGHLDRGTVADTD
jgi:hypothetical protein